MNNNSNKSLSESNSETPTETEKMCVSKREFVNLIKNRDMVYQKSQENNLMLKAKLDSTQSKLDHLKKEYDNILDDNVRLSSNIQIYKTRNTTGFDFAEYEKKHKEIEMEESKNREKRIKEYREKLYAKEEKDFMEQLKRERIEKLKRINK